MSKKLPWSKVQRAAEVELVQGADMRDVSLKLNGQEIADQIRSFEFKNSLDDVPTLTVTFILPQFKIKSEATTVQFAPFKPPTEGEQT